MSTGKFIVVEGPNYAGKSTVIRDLAAELTAQGREVVSTREPGGTEFGEAIRPILKNPSTAAGTFATALAFNAARKQHGDEVIGPALARGAVVLCDRYYMSTEIFQCELATDITPQERSLLRLLHTTFLQPDLTIFILPSPAVIVSRVRAANRAAQKAGYADRFEGNGRELTAYNEYADAFAADRPTLTLRPQMADEGKSLLPKVVTHPVFARAEAATSAGV